MIQSVPEKVEDVTNAVVFVPLPNWNGITWFEFSCIDQGNTSSNIAVATLNINPVDDHSHVGGPLFALQFTGTSVLQVDIVNSIRVGTIDFWLQPHNTSEELQNLLQIESEDVAVQRAGSTLIVKIGDSILEAEGLSTMESWTHVAITLSGSSSSIFLNGIQVNSGNVSGPLQLDGTSLTLGLGFVGKMDEFRMWPTPLDLRAIQMSLRTKYYKPTSSALSMGFTFDEGVGIQTHDISGNENHGSLGLMDNIFSIPLWVESTVPSFNVIFLDEDTLVKIDLPF